MASRLARSEHTTLLWILPPLCDCISHTAGCVASATFVQFKLDCQFLAMTRGGSLVAAFMLSVVFVSCRAHWTWLGGCNTFALSLESTFGIAGVPSPDNFPARRYGHGLCLDEPRRRLLMFGGNCEPSACGLLPLTIVVLWSQRARS